MRLVLAIAVLFASDLVAPANAAAPRNMDGKWEGSLTVVYPADTKPGAPAATFTLRVEIAGDKARVFLKGDKDWIEAKPGAFRVQRLRSNAVLTAIDSGQDEEGTWVETWSVAIAQKADDQALAIYSRLVNNEDLPPTSDHKGFSVAGQGELKRQ